MQHLQYGDLHSDESDDDGSSPVLQGDFNTTLRQIVQLNKKEEVVPALDLLTKICDRIADLKPGKTYGVERSGQYKIRTIYT